MPLELPQITPAPRERADARRNRERILCAAVRLIEERGVEAVSMDDVAAAAGVGKGTLYRRFGDRSSLLFSILDDEDRALQEALIRGEPPLGPGAPACERLHAFGDEIMAFLERRGALFLAAEADRPGRRFASPPYLAYRTHVGLLLRSVLGDGPRTEYLADALMAPLAAQHFLHQRHGRGLPLEEVRAGWHALVDAVLTAEVGDRDAAAHALTH